MEQAETTGVSEVRVRELGQRLTNWGRWGESDERGTLNLITEAALAAAAGCVRRGMCFDLGIDFDESGPQPGRGGRNNPIRLMRSVGEPSALPGPARVADDSVFMPLQCATQWDSLAHVHYDGHLYNGFVASDSLTSRGAEHCSIAKAAPGVAGRGVLLDIAHLRGVDWLEAGERIGTDDLDRACESQGVEVREGDILLVRTGWRQKWISEKDRRTWIRTEPGLTLDCATWLHERGVAAVASDNWGVEVYPGESPDVALPLHMVLLRDLGMMLGEMFDLEDLARDCQADGVWEVFLVAPILKFTGGVGCPVSPLAFK